MTKIGFGGEIKIILGGQIYVKFYSQNLAVGKLRIHNLQRKKIFGTGHVVNLTVKRYEISDTGIVSKSYCLSEGYISSRLNQE